MSQYSLAVPFAQIEHFNKIFGNPKGDLSKLDWAKLKSQVQILKEEFEEVYDAIMAEDIKETRDGCSDVIVVATGIAWRAGIPLEADLEAVYLSNMSKLVEDEDTLVKTYEKYAALGLECYHEGQYPEVVVKSAKDQIIWENGKLKTFPKGKILKSALFKEPVFQ